jgi:hypothetical protein
MWRHKLTQLRRQIRDEILTGEALKLRVFAIHHGVERLENSVRSLEENFGVDFKDTKTGVSMLNIIHKVVNNRSCMIVDVLKIDGGDHEDEAAMSEGASSDHGNLANLTYGVHLPNGNAHLTPSMQRSELVVRQGNNNTLYSLTAIIIFHLIALLAAFYLNLWGKWTWPQLDIVSALKLSLL